MKEVWRDIKGYEGYYQVSSCGRVKSLKYNKEKILKLSQDGGGYYHCDLYLNGNQKTIKVHKLVAIAFLGHKPNGMKIVVDHINNVKTDNRLENLQLISHRKNLSKDKKGYSSQYVGVTWYKPTSKWKAQIGINGKKKHLGLFSNELQAAQAYQLALKII